MAFVPYDSASAQAEQANADFIRETGFESPLSHHGGNLGDLRIAGAAFDRSISTFSLDALWDRALAMEGIFGDVSQFMWNNPASFASNPASLGYIGYRSLRGTYKKADLGPVLSPEEAAKKYSAPGLKFEQPIHEATAAFMQRTWEQEARYQEIISQDTSGFFSTTTVAKFGAELAASLVDPVQMALNFVPPLRLGRMGLALRGEAAWSSVIGNGTQYLGKSLTQRALIRTGEATATGALIGGVTAGEHMLIAGQDGRDYSMAEFLSEVAFGGGFYGVFHVGGGFVGDLFDNPRNFRPVQGVDFLTPADNANLSMVGGNYGKMLQLNPHVVAAELKAGRSLSESEALDIMKAAKTPLLPDVAAVVGPEIASRRQIFEREAQSKVQTEVLRNLQGETAGAKQGIKLSQATSPEDIVKALEADTIALEREVLGGKTVDVEKVDGQNSGNDIDATDSIREVLAGKTEPLRPDQVERLGDMDALGKAFSPDGSQSIRANAPRGLHSDLVEEFSDSFEQLTGRRITLFDGPEGSSSGLTIPNRKGVVYLNANGKYPLQFLAGHELGHDIKKSHPELYKELSDYLRSFGGDRSKYEAELKRLKYREDQFDDEFVNDFIGNHFNDIDFWKELQGKDKNLFEKIAEAAIKFLDTLIDRFSSLGFRDIKGQFGKEWVNTRTKLAEILEKSRLNKPLEGDGDLIEYARHPDDFEELTLGDKFNELQAKRHRLLNEGVIRPALEKHMSRFSDGLEGIQAILVGTNKPVEGARNSIANEQISISNIHVGRLFDRLMSVKGFDLFKSKECQRDIARGLWKLGQDPTAAIALPSPSLPVFHEIAKAIDVTRRELVSRANRAGAAIHNLPGYIFRQSHDMSKVAKAGFETWRDGISGKLDWARIEEQWMLDRSTAAFDATKKIQSEAATAGRQAERIVSRHRLNAQVEELKADLKMHDESIRRGLREIKRKQKAELRKLSSGESIANRKLEHAAELDEFNLGAAESREEILGEIQESAAKLKKAENEVVDTAGRNAFAKKRQEIFDSLPAFDREAFLKGAYDGISTGIHLQEEGSMGASGLRMRKNEANRISASRKLHFKSADDFLDYNDEFGTGALSDSVLQGLEHLSHSVALMETLGPNPEQMFLDLMDKVRSQRTRLGTLESLKKYGSLNMENRLHNLFATISGADRIPGNVTLARIGSGIRAWVNMSKLGQMIFAQFSDVGNASMELKFQGIPALRSTNELISRGFSSATDETSIRRGIALGAGMESFIGDVMLRYDAFASAGDFMHNTQNRFFKMTGGPWWTATHQRSVAQLMSSFLAEYRGSAWDGLLPESQRLLTMFDLNKDHWDAMRSLAEKAEDGRHYILPEHVLQMPEGKLKALKEGEGFRGSLDSYRDRIYSRWMNVFTDRTNYAILKPGAFERSLMMMGTRPGTIMGEMVRMMAQFKSFSFTMVTKVLARELLGKSGNMERIAGLSGVVAMCTLYGYLTLQMQQIASGKKMLDGRLSTFREAMLKGGGLGIIADYLLKDYSQTNRSFLADMAGPSWGTITPLVKTLSKVVTGEEFKPADVSAARGAIIFNNLVGIKQIIDYGVVYQLQEAINPGYLRRLEQKQKASGQEYLVPPASFAK